MIDDPIVEEALRHIFPLLPWAMEKLQTSIDPLTFVDLESSTKARIVYNLAMREGERRFADVPDIDFVTSRSLMHFALPTMLVRVKHAQKGTLDICTNNTGQTSEWTHQLPLDGMADPRDHLHLVYVTDQLWSRIDRSIVGFYHGRQVRDWREIDVDSWYQAAPPKIEPFIPAVEFPPLRLKPGVVAMPLEVVDGIQ